MIRKKVWRYYCEFCGKSGCSGGHMKAHESRCTMNPNRICGTCSLIGNKQEEMSVLVSAIGAGDSKGVEELRRVSDGCHACMLASIRQAGLVGTVDPKDFDYSSARDDFWKTYNQDMNCNIAL